jgi:hypothetical protein
MKHLKLLSVKPSSDPAKKFDAKFESETGREKTVRFGARGMDDYTKTHDKEQRRRYIERHSARENFQKPDTPGALSRWLLWGESTSMLTNLAAFRRKFNL